MNKVRIIDGLKKGLKKYWWIIGIVVLIKLTQPDLSFKLGTQSIFSGFGVVGISLGALMVIGALLMTLFSGGTLVPLATPILIAGWILMGGSGLSIITDLIKSISTTGFIIGAFVLAILFFMFKRK